MAKPKNAAAHTVAETFNMAGIIAGLVSDLQRLRDGRMSVEQALAAAQLARQINNLMRNYLSGQRLINDGLKLLPTDAKAVDAKAKP